MLKKMLGWVKQWWLSLTTIEEGEELVTHEVTTEPATDWFEEALLIQEIERAHRYVAEVERQKQLTESRRTEQIRIWRENNRMLDEVYARLSKQQEPAKRSQLKLVA